jgi:hypothetical protein
MLDSVIQATLKAYESGGSDPGLRPPQVQRHLLPRRGWLAALEVNTGEV